MRIVATFVIAFIAFACNSDAEQKTNNAAANSSGSKWDSTNRFSFINECMNGDQVRSLPENKAFDYCKCMLAKVEQRFPIPDSILNNPIAIDSTTVQQWEAECLK